MGGRRGLLVAFAALAVMPALATELAFQVRVP